MTLEGLGVSGWPASSGSTWNGLLASFFGWGRLRSGPSGPNSLIYHAMCSIAGKVEVQRSRKNHVLSFHVFVSNSKLANGNMQITIFDITLHHRSGKSLFCINHPIVFVRDLGCSYTWNQISLLQLIDWLYFPQFAKMASEVHVWRLANTQDHHHNLNLVPVLCQAADAIWQPATSRWSRRTKWGSTMMGSSKFWDVQNKCWDVGIIKAWFHTRTRLGSFWCTGKLQQQSLL